MGPSVRGRASFVGIKVFEQFWIIADIEKIANDAMCSVVAVDGAGIPITQVEFAVKRGRPNIGRIGQQLRGLLAAQLRTQGSLYK